jgi:hypothetical protein
MPSVLRLLSNRLRSETAVDQPEVNLQQRNDECRFFVVFLCRSTWIRLRRKEVNFRGCMECAFFVRIAFCLVRYQQGQVAAAGAEPVGERAGTEPFSAPQHA